MSPSRIERARRLPGLFRNYVSFVGSAIVFAALSSIVFLFLIEAAGGGDNP